nr:unnamed protein product [Naegleria fowleri]
MVKEGYLFKQEKSSLRKNQHWQKYYCILTADRLDLYEKEGQKNVKLSIKIKDKYVAEGCDNFSRKVDTFKIEESSKKVHYFNCASPSEYKAWMNMLAIHGANPIQPPYQSREHLFSTDLNDLFGFDEWLKEVKNSVSKSYPSVIAHWFLFVYDKKEKIFIPRMVLMHETGIVTCYSKENAKEVFKFTTNDAEITIYSQSEAVFYDPISIKQKANILPEEQLDTALLTPITSIISVKTNEKWLIPTPYSEKAMDAICRYRINIRTNYDDVVMLVAKEKAEILEFIGAAQKSGSKLTINVKHINEEIDDNGDIIRDSYILSAVKDSCKISLAKGKILEPFVAQNKFETSVETDEIVEILESYKNQGITLIRKTDSNEQGLVPAHIVQELRKKEIPKDLDQTVKKKTAAPRRLPDRNAKNIRESLAITEMQHELFENAIDRKNPKAKPPEMHPYELSKEEQSQAASFPPPPPRRFTPEVEVAFKKVSEISGTSVTTTLSSTSTSQELTNTATDKQPPQIPEAKPKKSFIHALSSSMDSSTQNSTTSNPKLPVGAVNPLSGRIPVGGVGLPIKTTPGTPQDKVTPGESKDSNSTPSDKNDDKSIDNFGKLTKENETLKKQIETEKENSDYLTNQLGKLREEIATLKTKNQALEKVNTENVEKLKQYQGSQSNNEQLKQINNLLDTINRLKDEHQKAIEKIKKDHSEELERTTRKLTLEFETEKNSLLRKLEEQQKKISKPVNPLLANKPTVGSSSVSTIKSAGSSPSTNSSDSSLEDLKRQLEQEKALRLEETRELKEQLRAISKKMEFEREQYLPLMQWVQSQKQ